MSVTGIAQGCDESQVPGTNIVASIQQGISERASRLEAGGSNWPDQWADDPWDDWGDTWAQMASL